MKLWGMPDLRSARRLAGELWPGRATATAAPPSSASLKNVFWTFSCFSLKYCAVWTEIGPKPLLEKKKRAQLHNEGVNKIHYLTTNVRMGAWGCLYHTVSPYSTSRLVFMGGSPHLNGCLPFNTLPAEHLVKLLAVALTPCRSQRPLPRSQVTALSSTASRSIKRAHFHLKCRNGFKKGL